MVKEAGYSLAVATKKRGGMMQGLIFSPSAELASIRIWLQQRRCLDAGLLEFFKLWQDAMDYQEI